MRFILWLTNSILRNTGSFPDVRPLPLCQMKNSFCWYASSLVLVRTRALAVTAVLSVAMLVTASAALPQVAHAADTAADSRKAFSATSPSWLRSVGKLTVPGSRWQDGRRQHYIEDCTATLVDLPGASKNRWIITAWHCLEHYADLSRRIVFSLPHSAQPSLSRDATVVAGGNSMHEDWALLRLDHPVDPAQAPPMALGAASGVSATVSMAGFSRDEGLGQRGAVLTYDEHCRLVRKHGRDFQTNCTAFKGASGGPVVEAGSNGSAELTGVVSQGDSASVSVFVPIQRFFAQLRQY